MSSSYFTVFWFSLYKIWFLESLIIYIKRGRWPFKKKSLEYFYTTSWGKKSVSPFIWFIAYVKVIIQVKLFERCTHLLYCSLLSLGGNVNTRRMSKPDMRFIFHIKKSMKYSGHRTLLYVNCQNFKN